MKTSRFAFVRTTTFRLALVYTVIFGLFSAILLGYLYQSTVGTLRSEADTRIEAEMRTLAVAYNTGGMDRLEQSLIERALVPGRTFRYQLETPDGDRIVGDFPALPVSAPAIPGDVKPIQLEIEMPRSDSAPVISEAEGRIVKLENGSVLLVAVETGERGIIVGRITQAVTTAAPIGIILALIGGFFISRYASRRAEALARTTEAVMAGDLSERARVHGSRDEFDRLAERLNAMLDKLERLMAASRHTGDAIAHDLRSPLSRLRNRLEAALVAPMDGDKARDIVGQTVEEVDQVLATFNAILRLSRLDAGAEGRFVRFDLGELAEEMAELFEPVCEDAGLQFEANIGRLLTILGDRDLLAQAVSNLIDNAVKYTPGGGRIELTAIREGNAVELTVSDSGPGIPEAERDRAKERFYRLDGARTHPGSGLGLSLVDAVAELHKGELLLQPAGGPETSPGLKAVLRLPWEK